MKSILSVLLAVLVFLSVEKVSGQLRILGGDDAPLEFGMFHTSIQNLTGYHVCGGAVVSQWLVVTAAHCVHEVNPAYVKIVAGTNNLNNNGQQYDISEIIIHDDYIADTRENDIALIEIKKPFDLNHVHVIEISKNILTEGDKVYVAGFGALEPDGLPSCKMQTLNLTVFNQETCEYALRYASTPVTRKMFCTFSTFGEGTCHGDSGSPLINIEKKFVGVVSWGIPCAVGFPDVHTRITPYIDWIQEHIVRAHCAPRTYNIIDKLKEIARYGMDVPVELQKMLANESL